MAQEEVTLHDVVDTTTDEFQYRLICLKMSHMAQETIGDLCVEAIMKRADRYWEFILGSNPEKVLAAVRKVMEETEGSA